ncbi:hypothetical protein HED60_03785 [Planctomycetales bacterium ZRK34]|nr:hypothetical protein HED60_03785 [Planctomycetales bacterium ZRK34]
MSIAALLAATTFVCAQAQTTDQLIAVLKSPQASVKDKADACRALQRSGDPAAAPALGALLPDAKFSHMARVALESMDNPVADQTLRDALTKAQGLELAGVINSIGQRRDAAATAALVKLLDHKDRAVASAAGTSLALLANDQAVDAIAGWRVTAPDDRKPCTIGASLLLAQRLTEDGKGDAAAKICDSLLTSEAPAPLRVAAFTGLLDAQPAKAPARIAAAVVGTDADLRPIAIGRVAGVRDAAVVAQLAAALPKLAPDDQVQLVGAMANIPEPAACKAVHDAVNSAVPGVRTAAIAAIAVCGQPSDVPMLCKLVADGPADADRNAAVNSIQAIRGQTADQAIIACLKSAPEPAKIRLIDVLTDRNTTAAAGELMTLAARGEPRVRIAAFKAIGKLLPPDQLPALVELMIRQDAATMGHAEKAVVSVARRGADPDKYAVAVLEPLASQQPLPTRCSLVRVLGGIGGAKALEATCAAMKHENPTVRDTAMRSLSIWPDAGAVDVLLSIFKSTDNNSYRGMALAGFTRLLALDGRAAADKAKLLAELMPAMKDTAERRQLLSAMAEVPDAGALTLIDQTLAADAAVRAETDLAKLKVARAIAGSNPDVALATARSLMQKDVHENIRREAAKIVRALRK